MPYCSECGSEIEGSEKFCPECGSNINEPATAEERTQETGEKKDDDDVPWKTYGDVSDTKEDGEGISIGKTLAGIAVFIILMAVVGTFVLGLGENVESDTSPSDTVTEPYTDAPEELMIEVGALPSGWSVTDIDRRGETDANVTRTFLNMRDGEDMTVQLWVYDTVGEARQEYNTRTSEIQERISVSDRRIGAEAISYEAVRGVGNVIFRDANVVAKVQFGQEREGAESKAVRMAERVQEEF